MEMEKIIKDRLIMDDDILFTIQFDDLQGKLCIADVMKNNTPGYYEEDTYMLFFEIGGIVMGSLTLKELYKSIAGEFDLGPVSLSGVRKIYGMDDYES